MFHFLWLSVRSYGCLFKLRWPVFQFSLEFVLKTSYFSQCMQWIWHIKVHENACLFNIAGLNIFFPSPSTYFVVNVSQPRSSMKPPSTHSAFPFHLLNAPPISTMGYCCVSQVWTAISALHQALMRSLQKSYPKNLCFLSISHFSSFLPIQIE